MEHLLNKYNEIFLEQAYMGFLEFNSLYMKTGKMKTLYERKEFLNNAFVYTNDVKERVLNLQELFTQKAKEQFYRIENIEKYIKTTYAKDLENNDDVIIHCNVDLFSPSKYDAIEEMDGNPFFSYEPSAFYFQSKEDYFHNLEYNLPPEFTCLSKQNHPLQTITHNYLMHELFDHTILSYSDILEIEEVWINGEINLQKIFKV